MSFFVAQFSVTQTIGTAAANVSLAARDINPKGEPRYNSKRGRICFIRNTHASQIVYVRQHTTTDKTEVTSTAFHVLCGPGEEVAIALREDTTDLRCIASGASTIVNFHVGDAYPSH
jgi:hypothetical protein